MSRGRTAGGVDFRYCGIAVCDTQPKYSITGAIQVAEIRQLS